MSTLAGNLASAFKLKSSAQTNNSFMNQPIVRKLIFNNFETRLDRLSHLHVTKPQCQTFVVLSFSDVMISGFLFYITANLTSLGF